MSTGPLHLYARQARLLARSEATIAAVARQSDRARANRVATVLTLKHLAQLSDVPYFYLRQVVQRVRDPYTDIALASGRPGQTRAISAPEPLLLQVQRWLLHSVLSSLAPHPASFAYHRGRSAIQCARQHLGANWIVKFDLRQFFHQIAEARAYQTYLTLGYSPLLSFEMTRISTRALSGSASRSDPAPYISIPSYAVEGQGVLPQGAPTSGALANEAARPLDSALATIARTRGLVYTRYSDDLTFSADAKFQLPAARELIAVVGRAVTSAGFEMQFNGSSYLRWV